MFVFLRGFSTDILARQAVGVFAQPGSRGGDIGGDLRDQRGDTVEFLLAAQALAQR
jgi:hypothetical protein